VTGHGSKKLEKEYGKIQSMLRVGDIKDGRQKMDKKFAYTKEQMTHILW
jgi:hypothetical protein